RPSSTPKRSKPISERELRKKARKLDLAPILGKAFRYVAVDKNGLCKEIDAQTVHERRESIIQGKCSGTPSKSAPIKKLRKVRKVTPLDSSLEESDVTRGGVTKLAWLPNCFTTTRTTATHVSGWVSSEGDLADVLTSHSCAFSCRFVSWYRGRGPENSFDSKRIAWKREDIEPDCPFTIDSYEVRHCTHGIKLKRLTEVRESYQELEEIEDSPRRSLTCLARLKIRRVIMYEDFRVNPEEKTKKKMFEQMACVKQKINRGHEVTSLNRIYLQLPLPAAHKNHTVPEFGENLNGNTGCGGRVKEVQCIKPLSSKEQEKIGLESESELKESEDCASSASYGFSMAAAPDNGAERNIDEWKEDPPFIFDTVSKDWGSSVPQIDERNKQVQLETRPPQKRTHVLAACKVDCPARIKVKRVSLYESFRLEETDSRRKKDDKMLMLKHMISSGTGDLQATPAIFLQLPLASAHRNHQVSVPVGCAQGEITNQLLASHVHCNTDQQQQQQNHQQQQQHREQYHQHQKYHHQHQQQQQHHGDQTAWLPATFTVTACEAGYVTGWVSTEQEYLHVLERHRLAFGCSFLAWSNDKERTLKAEADRRVMWKKDFIEPGCPLTVHHSLILACAYSDQGRAAKAQLSPMHTLAPELSCLAPQIGDGGGVIQVPHELVPGGTSLEIQYLDTGPHHEFPGLPSVIKGDETYIILVENS
ncbi:hypothetical protein EGW08_015547, partial [Elysia chlorotica]